MSERLHDTIRRWLNLRSEALWATGLCRDGVGTPASDTWREWVQIDPKGEADPQVLMLMAAFKV